MNGQSTGRILLAATCLLAFPVKAQSSRPEIDAPTAAAEAAAAAATAADEAFARWLRISRTETSEVHLDMDSVLVNGERRRVWNRITYSKLGMQREKPGAKKFLALFDFDCTGRTRTTLHIIAYDELGQPVNGSGAVDLPQATPVAPDTVEERALRAVCNVQKPR